MTMKKPTHIKEYCDFSGFPYCCLSPDVDLHGHKRSLHRRTKLQNSSKASHYTHKWHGDNVSYIIKLHQLFVYLQ